MFLVNQKKESQSKMSLKTEKNRIQKTLEPKKWRRS